MTALFVDLFTCPFTLRDSKKCTLPDTLVCNDEKGDVQRLVKLPKKECSTEAKCCALFGGFFPSAELLLARLAPNKHLAQQQQQFQ